MSDLVLAAHPDIERYGQLSEERARALDSGQPHDDAPISPPSRTAARLAAEQTELIQGLRINAAEAAEVYRRLADVVDDIVEVESEALDLLRNRN